MIMDKKSDYCLFCQRPVVKKTKDRFLFDDDDDDEEEEMTEKRRTCKTCGVDKAKVMAIKEARLTRGVIKHHARVELDVDDLFDRMTLKERYAPEAKVFTLNKENLAAFMRSKDYRRKLELPSDQLSVDTTSFDDLSTLWESDLMGQISQGTLSTISRVRSQTPNSLEGSRKRRTPDSPGFSRTPRMVKKRIARCLWNPYFMQHVRSGTPELSETPSSPLSS